MNSVNNNNDNSTELVTLDGTPTHILLQFILFIRGRHTHPHTNIINMYMNFIYSQLVTLDGGGTRTYYYNSYYSYYNNL
jgi:hypothetical protein